MGEDKGKMKSLEFFQKNFFFIFFRRTSLYLFKMLFFFSNKTNIGNTFKNPFKLYQRTVSMLFLSKIFSFTFFVKITFENTYW